MSATGLILDAVLMLLLIGAVGFGVRLERKLAALRAGQAEFARAVGELNAAAGKAETALSSLRAAGQETDLLHDRIVKARALKAELEALIAKAPARDEILPPLHGEGRRGESLDGVGRAGQDSASVAEAPPPGFASGSAPLPMKGRENVGESAEPAPDQAARRASMILQALAANQTAQQSLNRARRTLDEDLFAA